MSERERAQLRRVLGAAFVIGLVAGGCNQEHTIGGVDESANQGGTGGHTVDASMFQTFDAVYPGDVSGLGPSQSWTGQIDSYHLPTGSGSDVIRLSFATNPRGVVVGTMTLGTDAPPPPAADANVGYPPGIPAAVFYDRYIAEGFPYTMTNGSLAGQRLRFDVGIAELWSGWCGLQTPLPDSTSCLSNGMGSLSADYKTCTVLDLATGQFVPIDCAKFVLCWQVSVCTCTATACSANLANGGHLSVDVTFSGTTASGSIAGDIEHNINLTKDP